MYLILHCKQKYDERRAFMKHRMYRSYILRLVALLLTVTVLLSDFTGFSFANPDEEAVIE